VALFAQPWAAAQLGWLGGPLLLAVAALLALYTAQMVITLRRAAATLPSVDDPALASLPALVSALLGGTAGAVAELLTAAAALGSLATYLATAAAFLAPLLPAVAPHALVWALAPAAAALCIPRSLEHAALIAVFGSVAALLTALLVSVTLLRNWRGPAQPLGPFAESSAWAPLLLPPELPAAAAAASTCCTAFALHFTVPALAAAMAQPRRCMEAVGRGWLSAAGVMAVLGGVGGAALGREAPRFILSALRPGPGATLLRCLAALDLLYTAPLLARPGFLVVEAALERGMGRRPGRRTTAVVRLLLVAGAAAGASLQGLCVALLAVAGAAGCALLLPPLLLLLSTDGEGGALVRTSAGERAMSVVLALIGIAAMALALVGARDGSVGAVQLAAQAPLGSPPAPVELLQPTPAPYDYVGDKPPVYAFKRQAVLSSPVLPREPRRRRWAARRAPAGPA